MTDINKLCDELEEKRDASVDCEPGAYWDYVDALIKHAQPLIDAARNEAKLLERIKELEQELKERVEDFTVIKGDKKVIISRSTAREALLAMDNVRKSGGYLHVYADDASFIRASLEELTKASKA